MKIGGKSLRDHIQLLAPLFALLFAVWLLRIVLSVAHTPNWLIRAFSLTGAVPLTILLAALLIHLKDFGGYSNVVWSAFLLTVWGQLLIVAAVGFSVLVGVDNVYSVPEFSLPMEDPLHLLHMASHVAMIPLGTLLGAAMGSFLLWLLRAAVPRRRG